MSKSSTAPAARLLTVADLAELLHCPVTRIYENWRVWNLPTLRIGNHLRFRASEIDAWLETRREQ